MSLLGRRVYLAPSYGGCSSVVGRLLLDHHCRGCPKGAVQLQAIEDVALWRDASYWITTAEAAPKVLSSPKLLRM